MYAACHLEGEPSTPELILPVSHSIQTEGNAHCQIQASHIALPSKNIAQPGIVTQLQGMRFVWAETETETN